MHDVWTIAETNRHGIKEVSFELLARARELADTLNVHLVSVVIGGDMPLTYLKELIHRGADIVYAVQHEELTHFTCTSYSRILTHLVKTYTPQIVIAAATTTGRTLLPYAAVKLHTGLTADCTELSIEKGTGALLQTRPAIGGNIMATIRTSGHRPQMATVRPKSTHPLPAVISRKGEIIVIPFKKEWSDNRVTVTSVRNPENDQVSIEESDIVVSGGRGLKKRENFSIIHHLAQQFGGHVGASRDAVDRGWISYPHQVGLSGKTISPRLYMGIGISGAVQHLAGIKTAECIVAINSDEEAHLIDVADFAIIGDLFQIIPEIEQQLAERRRNR